jgi:hypothetical protein
MHDPAPVLILGAAGFLGREIARLSVALTHPTIGIDLAPAPCDEPWTQGVDWRVADVLDPDSWSHLITPKTRVIAALGEQLPRLTPELLRITARAGAPRLVLASAHLPILPLDADLDACSLALPPLWGEVALRQELAAMAALRVALEPNRYGILRADEIALLGDAMMLQ